MDKWYAIAVICIAAAVAVGFVGSNFATAPIAIECVKAGSSWVATPQGGECRAPGYTE